MMSKNIIFFFALLPLFKVTLCIAQSTTQDYNFNYIDSIEKETKLNFCNNILYYPETYKYKKIAEDKKILLQLNEILLKDFSVEKLISQLSKGKNNKIQIGEKKNGLISIIHFLFKGNFIKIDLKVEAIDSSIYRKNIAISTFSNGRCGESKFRIFDFNVFKKYFLTDLLFKINFGNNELQSKSYDEKKLLKLSSNHTSYNFSMPTSSNDGYVNAILLNQYNNDSARYYSYLKAPSDFIFLIKNHKYDLLQDLLFSPNYLYSVNAMESLQYLSGKNEINLDESLKKQIEIIRHSNYIIAIKKTDDLFMDVNGYSELKMTDDFIIKKYKNSL